jgi:hypothetical protein
MRGKGVSCFQGNSFYDDEQETRRWLRAQGIKISAFDSAIIVKFHRWSAGESVGRQPADITEVNKRR